MILEEGARALGRRVERSSHERRQVRRVSGVVTVRVEDPDGVAQSIGVRGRGRRGRAIAGRRAGDAREDRDALAAGPVRGSEGVILLIVAAEFELVGTHVAGEAARVLIALGGVVDRGPEDVSEAPRHDARGAGGSPRLPSPP